MDKGNKIKVIRIPIPPPLDMNLASFGKSNAYLIGNEKETILIDAGFNDSFSKEAITKAITDHRLAMPKKVILTHAHPDHAAGVHQLSDWSIEVYCHESEVYVVKKVIPDHVQIKQLENKDALHVDNVSLSIIHSPGHTPGHISIYIPSEEILIAGDNIVSDGTTWIGAPDGDMKDYMNSLIKLNKLHIKKIGPGHGDWVLNPHEQINFVINRRLKREDQIKSLLQKHGKLTSFELTNYIYKDTIHPDVFEFAKLTTEAHLLKLIKDQVVLEDNAKFSLLN